MSKHDDEHAAIDLALVALLRPLGEKGASFDTITTMLHRWTDPQLGRGLVRLATQGLVRSYMIKGEKMTRWVYCVPPGLRYRTSEP